MQLHVLSTLHKVQLEQPRPRRFDVLRRCVARAREERVGENARAPCTAAERQSAGDEAAVGVKNQ